MQMMTSRHDPETTLRRLNEAGVFGRFVPGFRSMSSRRRSTTCITPIRSTSTPSARSVSSPASRPASSAEDHPLASEIVHKIPSRPVLYLAVLLHDIAKGRGGIIRCWAPRW